MKKVLVVDDEEMIQNVLREILTRSGFEVEVACDGIEALEKMHNTRFACLVTDLQMPRMNGVELAREAVRLYPQVPRIMMTARRDLAEDAPVYRVVAKPVRMNDLVNLVKWLTGEPMQ